MMEFFYDSYRKMLELLIRNGYKIRGYENYKEDDKDKSVILRHDVDISLEYATRFSKIEREKKVRATYFILLSTDFYNVASRNSQSYIHEIKENGGVYYA